MINIYIFLNNNNKSSILNIHNTFKNILYDEYIYIYIYILFLFLYYKFIEFILFFLLNDYFG